MDFKTAKTFLIDRYSEKGYVPSKVNTERSFIIKSSHDGSYIGLSDLGDFIQMTFVNLPCDLTRDDVSERVRVVEEIDGQERVIVAGPDTQKR
jgi:hypothetical protein